MANQRTNKTQKGYSATEAKNAIDKYIDESAERLQKKLQNAWKKQASFSKKLSYA